MVWSDKHSNNTVVTNRPWPPVSMSLGSPLPPLASHESLAVIRIMPCGATASRWQTPGSIDSGTALDSSGACQAATPTHIQIKIPCRGPVFEISGNEEGPSDAATGPRCKRDKMPREGETDPCARANPI